MKSILRLPLIVWVLGTVLVYCSVLVSPLTFKFSGVLSFGIPLVLIFNFIYLIISLILKWKTGFVAFFLLVIAFPFYPLILGFDLERSTDQEGFSVLNYNTQRYHFPESSNEMGKLEDWILENESEIICLQEFAYGSKRSSGLINNSNYNRFFGGYANSFAILSKFPIINTGQLFEDNQTNNVTYADLKIDTDTVRVYNIHLQSMGINPDKIQSTEGIKNEYENIAIKFINASTERTRQIRVIEENISQCKYPVILAGDFNDVPFSYNYFKMRGVLKNAFEEAGSGFGITYNGKIPYLRIDNQFYSEGLEALSFSTLNDINYSDHFPLVGKYRITE